MKKLAVVLIILLISLLLFTCGCTPLNPPNNNVADYDGHNFMSKIDDDTPLSMIALPGTHDTGATKDFPLISGSAKCQSMTFDQQLYAGVRYMDVRLRRVRGNLDVYHGPVDQKLSFAKLLQTTYEFLDANPTETVIFCIKEESTPKGKNVDFDEMLNKYVEEKPSKWFCESYVPLLGQVRGKIVLMRRFHSTMALGFDASNGWVDNDTFSLYSNEYQLAVQDYYNIESTQKKWDEIVAFMEEMKSPQQNTYYLNNTSGYLPRLFGIPNINAVSNEINKKLVEYLKSTTGIVGIIACDHIDMEIAKEIVMLNFK